LWQPTTSAVTWTKPYFVSTLKSDGDETPSVPDIAQRMTPTRWLNPLCRSTDHLAFDCGRILTPSSMQTATRIGNTRQCVASQRWCDDHRRFVFGVQCRTIELSDCSDDTVLLLQFDCAIRWQKIATVVRPKTA
jgi:hypothetical protein